MAESFAEEYKEFLAGVRDIQEARYAISAVYCMQVYELIALARKEVNLIHRSPWTSVKVSYLLCRYYPFLLWHLVMWAYLGNHPAPVCNRVGAPVHILFAPCQIFPQGVMLTRAYAFSGRSKPILSLLLFCYACLIAVDIWAFCAHILMPPAEYYIILGGTGCFPNYGAGWIAGRIGYSMLAATLMDMVSLLVVITVCYRTSSRQVSLGRYFFSQGLASFVFVASINVGTAILFFVPPTYHTGIGLPVILVLSNIIACRVILHLRRKMAPTDEEISHRNSQIVDNAFVRNFHDTDEWLVEEDRVGVRSRLQG